MFPKYDRPFFFHFNKRTDTHRNLGKANGVTVCFLPQGPGNSEFVVATATAAKMDNFSKKKGRMIAEARARQNKKVVLRRAASMEELREQAEAVALQAAQTAR